MAMRDLVDIAVAGGRIRLACAGRGNPVVLLHGWALDHRIWDPQLDSLGQSFRLVAPDRRGFGESTAPPGLAQESSDILAILESVGAERASIVGLSQGGRIALRFAIAHPDRIDRLVLVGAPLDGFEPGPKTGEAIPLGEYRALARQGRLDEVRRRWSAHALVQVPPVLRNRLDQLLQAYAGRDLLHPQAEDGSRLAASLAAIAAPALVVTGEEDTAWRQLVGDALAYGLANARRVRIPGAGHLCSFTRPDAFNRLLEDFLEQADAPDPAALDQCDLQPDGIV